MMSRKVFRWLASSALFATAVAIGLVTTLTIYSTLKPGACPEGVEINRTDAEAHNKLGLALYDKDQCEEAIQEFRKAIELDPQSAPGHANLGRVLAFKDKADEAIAEFR
jgi:tetratricopeptide (TPR) repeat protein